jgi:hypothetical protein
MSMGEMSDSVLKMGSVTVRNTVFLSSCHCSLNIAPHPFVFQGCAPQPQPLALLQKVVIDKSMIKMVCGGHLKE